MPGTPLFKYLLPAAAGGGRTDANDAADEYVKADTLLRRLIAVRELSPKAQKKALKNDDEFGALLSAVRVQAPRARAVVSRLEAALDLVVDAMATFETENPVASHRARCTNGRRGFELGPAMKMRKNRLEREKAAAPAASPEAAAEREAARAATRERNMARASAAKAKTKTTNKAGGMKKPNLNQRRKAIKAAGFGISEDAAAPFKIADTDAVASFDLGSPHMQCFEALAMAYGGGTDDSGPFPTTGRPERRAGEGASPWRDVLGVTKKTARRRTPLSAARAG